MERRNKNMSHGLRERVPERPISNNNRRHNSGLSDNTQRNTNEQSFQAVDSYGISATANESRVFSTRRTGGLLPTPMEAYPQPSVVADSDSTEIQITYTIKNRNPSGFISPPFQPPFPPPFPPPVCSQPSPYSDSRTGQPDQMASNLPRSPSLMDLPMQQNTSKIVCPTIIRSNSEQNVSMTKPKKGPKSAFKKSGNTRPSRKKEIYSDRAVGKLANALAQPTEIEYGLSDGAEYVADTLGGEGPDEISVFKYLVKDMKGIGTPEEIREKLMPFTNSTNIYNWFKTHSTKFTLFEKENKLLKVAAYVEDAAYCLNYLSKRSCKDPLCGRYHICKFLLSGNCVSVRNCKFSHNVFDQVNSQLSEKLGFSGEFTNQEVLTILSLRYPHVCFSWNHTFSCTKKHCIQLHMCQNYILRKCGENGCRLNHSKDSDHNKMIIKAYRLQQMSEPLLNKLVYITKASTRSERTASVMDQYNNDDSSTRFETVKRSTFETQATANDSQAKFFDVRKRDETDQRDKKDEVQRSKNYGKKYKAKRYGNESFLRTDLNTSRQFLCTNNLTSQCKDDKCRDLHVWTDLPRLPYIWQVKVSNEWTCLPEDQSMEIEADYSAVREISEKHKLMLKGEWLEYHIIFSPNLKAYLSYQENNGAESEVDARRLSTRSYATGRFEEESFKTQWRWYRKNAAGCPQLFEKDSLQHTLEKKYLNGQKKFLYPGEDYSNWFCVDLRDMTWGEDNKSERRTVFRRPILVKKDDKLTLHFPDTLQSPPEVGVKLPMNWEVWDLAHPFELVELEPGDNQYKTTSEQFYAKLNNQEYPIDRMYRVQNHALWNAFKNHKTTMVAKLKRAGDPPGVEERILFHGTDSVETVRGICLNNFDHRICGKNATRLGRGAYFAATAKYSHHYTSPPERYIFVARVLVGEYTQGDSSYTRPPTKPTSKYELFDSCVDRMEDPTIFVVFDAKQYYPEFLIQYHHIKDQFKGSQTNRKPPLPPKPTYPAFNVQFSDKSADESLRHTPTRTAREPSIAYMSSSEVNITRKRSSSPTAQSYFGRRSPSLDIENLARTGPHAADNRVSSTNRLSPEPVNTVPNVSLSRRSQKVADSLLSEGLPIARSFEGGRRSPESVTFALPDDKNSNKSSSEDKTSDEANNEQRYRIKIYGLEDEESNLPDEQSKLNAKHSRLFAKSAAPQADNVRKATEIRKYSKCGNQENSGVVYDEQRSEQSKTDNHSHCGFLSDRKARPYSRDTSASSIVTFRNTTKPTEDTMGYRYISDDRYDNDLSRSRTPSPCCDDARSVQELISQFNKNHS